MYSVQLNSPIPRIFALRFITILSHVVLIILIFQNRVSAWYKFLDRILKLNLFENTNFAAKEMSKYFFPHNGNHNWDSASFSPFFLSSKKVSWQNVNDCNSMTAWLVICRILFRILNGYVLHQQTKQVYNAVLFKFEECVKLFLFYSLVFYWG